VWDFVVSASRLPNRMLLPALRGHGDTDWPATGYRLEDHRDDLIAFIEAMCEGPAILVGQATGATLALMIASRIPEQIRAVVAAQPAIGIAGAVTSMVRDQVVAQQHLASRRAGCFALCRALASRGGGAHARLHARPQPQRRIHLALSRVRRLRHRGRADA
jgi:pimeloyl-ACP methyl ester carboxylesterase